jgi:hypothetical protein
MKTRNAFVANSSSSSFLVVTLGDKKIMDDGCESPSFETDSMSMDIDTLILELAEAKAKGITRIEFEYGGGYDG